MNAVDVVSILFVTALLGGFGLQLWLASRQIRHVRAHREAVPQEFSATVSPQAHRKAADYAVARERLGMVSAAWGAVVLLGWTLLGGLDALHGWSLAQGDRAGLGPLATQLLFLLACSLIGGALGLPLAAYETFVLEQRFGFNRTTPGLWLADLARDAVVSALLMLPLAALVLALMGAAGPAWWLWAWAAFTGFVLLVQLAYPTLIAPLFNRFEPLRDEGLAARVQALMQRCGFRARSLLVMDGSRRSAHSNAYFTGLGASKRVVFYDTLLARLTHGQIEAVLAHELGHFHHRHLLRRMVSIIVFSAAALALLGWLATQTAFYAGLGVQPRPGQPHDALALQLFLLVAPAFAFFVTPVFTHFSRRDEFQADAYASTHADAQELRAALLKLYEDNASTLTPDPLYVRFHHSHPPAAERLAALAALASPKQAAGGGPAASAGAAA
ncbi:MAG: M48 family metallopeptidase [Rubrivivax sp.]